jgi:hypothetical protein
MQMEQIKVSNASRTFRTTAATTVFHHQSPCFYPVNLRRISGIAQAQCIKKALTLRGRSGLVAFSKI